MPVEVIELTPKPIEDAAEFVGMLKSRRSSTIQPQAEGFLTRILVKSGDRVTVGTPMFEIDDRAQQASIASLESILAVRQADAAFARQQAERAKKLLAVGASSQQEYDQAATATQTADAQVKAVQEQIRQQRAEWTYTRVASPATGIVGDVPVRVGDLLTKSTVLTTVDDNANLEVYINVPVQQAPRLKLGLPVRLVNEVGQTLVTERVNFVSASVDDATQTVLVKTPLAPRGGLFRSAQSVRALLVFDEAPGLTVPVVAVTRINGQYFVFVAEGGERGTVARQRAVNLGAVLGNEYVVRSGLKAGEKLIVSGIQKIGEGAPVSAMPASPAAPKPTGEGGPKPGEGEPAAPKPAGEGGKGQ
jgi:RND family efflux transporter MFP subunit